MHARAPGVVCAFLVFAASALSFPANAAVWLAAGDVHLDPFDRSKEPARAGSDTNRALLDSTVAAMHRALPDPTLVVLSGDFLAHHFARLAGRQGEGSADEAAIAAMRQIAGAFARAFPNATFAVALGNNDAPCGDYASDFNGPFLAAVTHIWAPLVDRSGAAPEFSRTFPTRGYYALTLRAQRVRVLVLDSVLFSVEYRGTCGHGAANAAADQLRWLAATLRATPPRMRNVVVMHVPPGYDALSTALTRGFLPWPFMRGDENAALIAALAAPDNHVAFALAGHAHRFDFRIAGRVPIVVLGAISPIYRNNPTFYALRVGSQGALNDIDAYALDRATGRWRGPRSFDAQWQVRRIDAASLKTIHGRLGTDPALRRAWAAASTGWAKGPREWRDADWKIRWCAQLFMNSGFAQCAGIERRASLGRALAVVVALLLVAGLVVAIVVTIRALRTKWGPKS